MDGHAIVLAITQTLNPLNPKPATTGNLNFQLHSPQNVAARSIHKGLRAPGILLHVEGLRFRVQGVGLWLGVQASGFGMTVETGLGFRV